ncbi:hypothetical protein [Gluconobacter morbifer]|uniref:Uncharacterized protein n=1 Tax=Gluconobacter morbifer G707 TaxID=1088869 RepID=G6XMB7_9PROT|nr:hypothetical protein [Gluconobacter morbifer]EHH67015.1 hypothetical protein GMO_26350 [Gluconobacter morbifer G707]
MAKGKYDRIAAHGLSVRLSLPGVPGLEPRQFLRVAAGREERVLGVDQVISRFSLEKGFVQEVVLRDRGGSVT